MTADSSPKVIDLALEAPFRLGAAEVRPATREVVQGDRRDVLEPRVMQVLVALAGRPGEVVSRNELIERCWGGRIVGDDAINRCIGQLRRLAQALGDIQVETIPRIGYRLHTVVAEEPIRSRGRAVAMVSAVAAVVAALAAFFVWLVWPRLDGRQDRLVVAVSTIQPVGDSAAIRSLAQDVSEDLLAAVPTPEVKAIASPKPRRSDFLLRGFARLEGQSLRVRLNLADGRSGENLWMADFEGPASAPSELRERVSIAMAEVVRCAAVTRKPGAGAIQDAAVRQFLRGCSEINDPNAAQDVLSLMRQVTESSPRFARGQALLAIFAAVSSKEVDAAAAARLKQEGVAAVQQALRLDPRDPLAYLAKEILVEPRSRWADRQAILDRGLQLNPNDSALLSRQGLVLAAEGRLADATFFQRRAVTLNPAAANPLAELADTLSARNMIDDAQAAIDKAVRLWPDNEQVAGVHFQIAALNGREREALAMLRDPVQGPRIGRAGERATWEQALEAVISGSSGARAQARDAVKRAVETHAMWTPDGVRTLSALGFGDDALAMAEAYVSSHPDYEPTYLFRAGGDALRENRNFLRLAHELGLLDYWRSTDRWPDFCQAPGLPYDCRKEAARLTATGSTRGLDR